MSFGGAVKLTGEAEYRRALSQIGQQLKEVGAQMKLTSASYDANDKSTEALMARSKDLQRQLELQKSKVSVLRDEYVKMAEQYSANAKKNEELKKTYDAEKAKLDEIGRTLGTTSAEYKAQQAVVNNLAGEVRKSTQAQDANEKSMSQMRTEILKAETDVKKTEKSISDLNDEMEDTDDAANSAKKGIDNVGDAAEKNEKKFAKLLKGLKGFGGAVAAVGTAAAAVGAKMVGYTKDLGEYADNMLTMSKVTGVSAEDLQAYTYAAELVDVSVETMSGALTKATKSMASAQKGTGAAADAYKTLGVSVTDVNGDLRDNEDVFWESIDALGQIQNETERDALAMQLFGKSAKELNPLIAAGSEEMRELTKEAKEVGAVLSDDQLTSASAFDDAMQRLQGGATAAKNAIGTVLLPQLTELAGSGKDLLAQFTNGILEANGDMSKIGETIGNVLSGAVKVVTDALPDIMAVGVGIVSSLLEGIISALPDVAETIVSVIPQLVQSLLGMVPQLITAGVQIVTGLLVGMKDAIPNIITSVIEVIPQIIDALTDGIPDLIAGAVEFLTAIVEAIPTVVESLSKALPQIIESVIHALIWAIPDILQGAVTMLKAIVQAIPQILPPLVKMLPEIIDTIVGTLGENLNYILDCAIELFMALVDAIPQILPPLMTALPDIITTITKTLLENLPYLIQMAIKLFMTLVQAIPVIVRELIKTLPTIIRTITKSLVEPVKRLFSGLWTAIKGIFSGVGKWFGEKFTAAKNAVVNAFKSIGEWFSKKWQAIKNVFSNVGGWFKEKFSDAWKKVKEVFSGWGEFFGNLWTKIKDKFSAIGTKIGNAISGAVKAGINGVISQIERIINGGINLINGAINLINKIPGVNIGNIQRVQFARLAKGAVVDRPMFAQIGENGAEAVVPLEKNTAWIKRVAAEMQQQMGTVVQEQPNAETQFNTMIRAFKQALSDMKIELDDEPVGEFVDRFVTRKIYS